MVNAIGHEKYKIVTLLVKVPNKTIDTDFKKRYNKKSEFAMANFRTRNERRKVRYCEQKHGFYNSKRGR